MVVIVTQRALLFTIISLLAVVVIFGYRMTSVHNYEAYCTPGIGMDVDATYRRCNCSAPPPPPPQYDSKRLMEHMSERGRLVITHRSELDRQMKHFPPPDGDSDAFQLYGRIGDLSHPYGTFSPSLMAANRYALFGCSSNDTDFPFMLPLATIFWKDCGYQPIIFMGSDPQPAHTKYSIAEAEKYGAKFFYVNDTEPLGMYTASIRVAAPLFNYFKKDDYLLLVDIDLLPLNCPYFYTHDLKKHKIYIDDYDYHMKKVPSMYPRSLMSETGATAGVFREILGKKPMPLNDMYAYAQSLCARDNSTCDEWTLGGLIHSWRTTDEKKNTVMKNNRTKILDRSFTHLSYPSWGVLYSDALKVMFMRGSPVLQPTYWHNSIDIHYKTRVLGYTFVYDMLGPYFNTSQQEWLVDYVERYRRMAPFSCAESMKLKCFDHASMSYYKAVDFNKKYPNGV